MSWTIEFEESAERDLARLDKPIQREIMRYLNSRIATADDPNCTAMLRFTNCPGFGGIVFATIALFAPSKRIG